MTPLAGAASLLHFRAARLLQWEAKGSWGGAAAPVNPDGAGEGRNQVRFALRLLGNPCLGSLQRDIEGRSTGNADGVAGNVIR